MIPKIGILTIQFCNNFGFRFQVRQRFLILVSYRDRLLIQKQAKLELLKYYSDEEDSRGGKLMEDGLHLPGLDVHLSETLCGACDSMANYDIVNADKPTCKNCISAAKQLFKLYKKSKAIIYKAI